MATKEIDRPKRRTLSTTAPFEASAKITPALRIGAQLRERAPLYDISIRHSPASVPQATALREQYLGQFAEADGAAVVLGRALFDRLDPKLAAAMISAMMGACGAKADRVMLAGMLDLIASDDIGVASGLWEPLHATPTVLALACKALIAKSTFGPKPAELHAACRQALHHLKMAHNAAHGLADLVRKCDAVLLQFAPDEWQRPYRKAHYRRVLPRMLELHAISGDGTDDLDDDGNPFRAALARVRARQLVKVRE